MSRRGRREGSVYQRQDGRWVGVLTVGYKDGKRQRRCFYGATRTAVKDALAAALNDQRQGLPVATPNQSVKAFLTRWLEDSAKPRLRPRSFHWYRQIVRDHLIPELGTIRLQQLTPQEVQALVTLKARTLSPRTVRNIRTILRTALKTAMTWRLVPWNVATLVDVPRVAKYEAKTLSVEQARRFVRVAVAHRVGPLFSVALACGFRLGEALGLGWEDVDLDAKTIRIRRSLQRVEKVLVFVEPKSKTSVRSVNVPAVAMVALERHKARQKRERLKAGGRWEATGLVFTTRIGTPIDDRNVRRDFRAILKEAKCPRIRIHDLRHTCATLLLVQGVHPRVVMDLLGHSQISLTLDTYSHVVPSLQAEATGRMDAILPAGKK